MCISGLKQTWWTEDQDVGVTVTNHSPTPPPAHPNNRHETSAGCLSLQLSSGWRRVPRQCCFSSWSLKAYLHLLHPHTGLNQALKQPKCQFPHLFSPPRPHRLSDYQSAEKLIQSYAICMFYGSGWIFSCLWVSITSLKTYICKQIGEN